MRIKNCPKCNSKDISKTTRRGYWITGAKYICNGCRCFIDKKRRYWGGMLECAVNNPLKGLENSLLLFYMRLIFELSKLKTYKIEQDKKEL